MASGTNLDVSYNSEADGHGGPESGLNDVVTGLMGNSLAVTNLSPIISGHPLSEGAGVAVGAEDQQEREVDGSDVNMMVDADEVAMQGDSISNIGGIPYPMHVPFQFIAPADLASRERLRKEICWLLSNVAADSHAQIETLLSAEGLIEAVWQVLLDGAEKSKREAVWMLANVAENGTVRQAGILTNHGAIAPLCFALQLDNSRSVSLALGALGALLEKAPTPTDAAQLGGLCDVRGRNPTALAIEAAGGIQKLRMCTSRTDLFPNNAQEMLDTYFASVYHP
jgi:hypothetical protein